jgi:hypothetical protein
MRALAIALLVTIFASVTLPAFAEESKALTRRSEAQKQEDEDIDKAYRAATRGGGAASVVKPDPWAKVRATDADKKTKP